MPESSKLKPSKLPSQAKARMKVKRGKGKKPQSLVSHLQEFWTSWLGKKTVERDAKQHPSYTATNIANPLIKPPANRQPSRPPAVTQKSNQPTNPKPTESNQQPEPVQKIARKRDRDRTKGGVSLPPIVRSLLSSASTVIGSGAVAAVVIMAILALTHPDSPFLLTPKATQSCQTKLNGQWQSNWGSISFEEKANSQSITGKYDYENLDRGKVKGKLTGSLEGNTLGFSWQETSERGQELKGKGSFLFQNQCKDFYGSYGSGEAESGKGNWRGNVIKILPIKK
jgi:hypothetical protein